MDLTIIGLIQLVIGSAIVLAGSMRHALMFLMLSCLFGGSASIILPALGGSSVGPAQFALIFVWMRILVPRGGFVGLVPDALRANMWLVLFVFYGIAIAFIGPRLFAGTIDVYPMRHTPEDDLDIIDALPLGPTSQNITAAFYLLGALLIAMATHVATRVRGGAATLVSGAIAIAWIHVAIGILAAAARDTPLDAVFDMLRNGTYTQRNDDLGKFVRIRGVFAEASSYAEFGFGFFVINAELWYRSIRPWATGMAALALAAILFVSTSSTAYVGLAGYLVFFALRGIVLPKVADRQKSRAMAGAILGLSVVAAIIVATVPHVFVAVSDMILDMTVNKHATESGQQRMFWAMQGWETFKASYGLGVGPGSFRSSSIFLAILGTMGVMGICSFLAYLATVIQPWRRSTWGRVDDLTLSLGGAFASAAMLTLIPAAVNAPGAHPGATFSILAGAALALRPRGERRTASEVVPEPVGAPLGAAT